MLSGYDFSNCDIPVRLNHFFVCECWSGREGSPKNSLRSDNRRLFWEKAVLWRGSSQNATMTGLRSEFLFHTEVLLENWDLLNSQKQKKRTFRELKSGEYFQSAAESRKTRSTNRSGASLMAGLHCAPGMRCEGNQSNQSNRRPPQPQRGRGKSRGTIISRQQGGGGGSWRREEERGGGGVMWLQTF